MKNDQEIFRDLFLKYSGKVYVFAMKITRSAELSEEIMQDVFMKVWVNREKLSSIQYFPSYIYTITKNHAFNVLKRLALEEKAKVVFRKELKEVEYTTEEKVIENDYQRIINNVIKKLPPQQRVVYGLCHNEGLKYEEVAQQLKISRLTVKTHMQHALRSIKSQLGHLLTIVFFFLLK